MVYLAGSQHHLSPTSKSVTDVLLCSSTWTQATPPPAEGNAPPHFVAAHAAALGKVAAVPQKARRKHRAQAQHPCAGETTGSSRLLPPGMS